MQSDRRWLSDRREVRHLDLRTREFPSGVNRNLAAQFPGRGGSRPFRVFSRCATTTDREQDWWRTTAAFVAAHDRQAGDGTRSALLHKRGQTD